MGDGFSGVIEFLEEGVEFSSGSLFVGLVVDDGLLEGGSEFLEFAFNFFEGSGAEGGGNLHKGQNGVGVSDLGEFGEDGIGLFLMGLEGGELFDDQFQSSYDFS